MTFDTYHPSRFDHQRLARDLLANHEVLGAKIEDACGIDREAVEPLLAEVIRFLNLVRFSDEMLTPSQTVDLAWHEFILCTQGYAEFCDREFGRMIHHHPGGEAETNREQFRLTRRLMQEHFGALETRFWGSSEKVAADCGACEAIQENIDVSTRDPLHRPLPDHRDRGQEADPGLRQDAPLHDHGTGQ